MGKASVSVFLIRHGIAEDHHPLGDEARGLTAEGRSELRTHARELRKQMKLRGLVTSPAVRAVQTAEIIAEAFGLDDVVVDGRLDAAVASGRSVAALLRDTEPGVALCGHNPSLSEALAVLLGPDAPASFRKGAVAALDREDHAFTLAWMHAPGRKPQR